MSSDTIDALIVSVVNQVEEDICDPDFYNDDTKYERLVKIFYDELEGFCTRDRNFN